MFGPFDDVGYGLNHLPVVFRRYDELQADTAVDDISDLRLEATESGDRQGDPVTDKYSLFGKDRKTAG